jgi:hypothetical protein
MRSEATATCLSWIPPTAVEGMFSLPFDMGVAHYDRPPPDELPDVGALLAADAIRFANQLHGWVEVNNGQITSHGMTGGGRLGSTTVRLRSHGLTFAGVALPDLVPPPEVHPGRIVFTQTAGGHTGAPVPRAVPHPPFWRLTAPISWSTITLTLHADGSSAPGIAAASPFPRHYLYGSDGRLTRKTALINYKDWIRQPAQEHTPWEGGGQPVPVARMRGTAERSLADAMLVSGPPPPARSARRRTAQRPADRRYRGSSAPRRAAGHRDRPPAGPGSRPRRDLRPLSPHSLQPAARHRARHDRLPAGCTAPRSARQPSAAWRRRRAAVAPGFGGRRP